MNLGLNLLVAATCLGGVAAAAVFSFGGVAHADPILDACEDVLKDRLKAPSTYKRIDLTETEKTIPLNEYRTMALADGDDEIVVNAMTRMMESDKSLLPVLITKFITYDAENSFGAPLRDVAECTYFDETPGGSRPSDSQLSLTVKVNGKNRTEWLLDSVNALGDD